MALNTKDLEFIETITSNMNVEIFKAYWRKHQVVCEKAQSNHRKPELD